MSYCVPGQQISYGLIEGLCSIANSKVTLQQSGTYYPYNPYNYGTGSITNLHQSLNDTSSLYSGSNWFAVLNELTQDCIAVINQNVPAGQNTVLPWIYNSIGGDDGSSIKVPGYPLGSPTIYNSNLHFWFTSSNSETSASFEAQVGGYVQGPVGQFTTTVWEQLYEPYDFESGFASVVPVSSSGQILQPAPQQNWITSQDYSIIVGGDASSSLEVPIACDFVINLGSPYLGIYLSSSTMSPTGPSGNVTLTDYQVGYWIRAWNTSSADYNYNASFSPLTIESSNWIPGASWELIYPVDTNTYWEYYNASGSNLVWAVCHFSGTIPPGTYTVTIQGNVPDDTYSPGVFDYTDSFGNNWYYFDWLSSPAELMINPYSYPNGGTNNSIQILTYMAVTGSNHGGSGNGWPVTSYDYSGPTITLETFGPNAGISAPGISNNAPVYNIDCSGLYNILSPGSTGYPVGIWSVYYPVTDISGSYYYWQDYPFSQSVMFDSQSVWPMTIDWNIYTSVPGLWSGKANPCSMFTVGNYSSTDYDYSTLIYNPWNYTPNGYGTQNPWVPLNYGSPVESSGMPGWGADTRYVPGLCIQDSQGNFQQCIAGGTSGNSTPGWGGNITTDNQVIWHMYHQFPTPASGSGGAMFYTGEQRPAVTSQFPFVWYNDFISGSTNHGTGSFFAPPTSSVSLPASTVWGTNQQWFNNNVGPYVSGWAGGNAAYGWWIYSISINKLGSITGSFANNNPSSSYYNFTSSFPSAYFPTPGSASVTLGCWQNNAFVEFPTPTGGYWTGNQYTVLWPLFSSAPLMYQCSERVNIDATVIIGESGDEVLFPIFADSLNQIYTMLQYLT